MMIPAFYVFTLVNEINNYTPSSEFQSFMNELVNVLSDNLSGISSTGYSVPSFSTAQISLFAADSSVPVGTLWFDSTLAKMVFKSAAGIIEVITSV